MKKLATLMVCVGLLVLVWGCGDMSADRTNPVSPAVGPVVAKKLGPKLALSAEDPHVHGKHFLDPNGDHLPNTGDAPHAACEIHADGEDGHHLVDVTDALGNYHLYHLQHGVSYYIHAVCAHAVAPHVVHQVDGHHVVLGAGHSIWNLHLCDHQ